MPSIVMQSNSILKKIQIKIINLKYLIHGKFYRPQNRPKVNGNNLISKITIIFLKCGKFEKFIKSMLYSSIMRVVIYE